MYSEPVTSSALPQEVLERMKDWKTPLRCLLVGVNGVGKSSAINTFLHVLMSNILFVVYAMIGNGVSHTTRFTTLHTNLLALFSLFNY